MFLSLYCCQDYYVREYQDGWGRQLIDIYRIGYIVYLIIENFFFSGCFVVSICMGYKYFYFVYFERFV